MPTAVLADQFPVLSATAVSAVTAMAGFGALRLMWSVMRAGIAGVAVETGSLTVATRSLNMTSIGVILTVAGVAAEAFSKATSSGVPPLERAELGSNHSPLILQEKRRRFFNFFGRRDLEGLRQVTDQEGISSSWGNLIRPGGEGLKFFRSSSHFLGKPPSF
ncbi:MAG: hypothetical protein HQL73_13400 [Magnetococcales bacterium]|nr:hypothetical protein [Magnetococcales bacterium]